MKGSVYQCMECKNVFGTTFISEGIECPYCGGPILPAGNILCRKEYEKIKNQLNKRSIRTWHL